MADVSFYHGDLTICAPKTHGFDIATYCRLLSSAIWSQLPSLGPLHRDVISVTTGVDGAAVKIALSHDTTHDELRAFGDAIVSIEKSLSAPVTA